MTELESGHLFLISHASLHKVVSRTRLNATDFTSLYKINTIVLKQYDAVVCSIVLN